MSKKKWNIKELVNVSYDISCIYTTADYFIVLIMIFCYSLDATEYENEDYSQVKFLLKKGVDINAVHTQDGFTPLIIAIRNGHQRIVSLLLRAGVDCNCVDSNGYTPLHYAARDGNDNIADLLLKHGATHTNSDGTTPLTLACQNGHIRIVESLYYHCKITTLEGLEAILVTESRDIIEYLCDKYMRYAMNWSDAAIKREARKELDRYGELT